MQGEACQPEADPPLAEALSMCTYSTKLELVLPRIFEKWKVSLRPAARQPLAESRAKKLPYHFPVFARADFFLLKESQFWCRERDSNSHDIAIAGF